MYPHTLFMMGLGGGAGVGGVNGGDGDRMGEGGSGGGEGRGGERRFELRLGRGGLKHEAAGSSEQHQLETDAAATLQRGQHLRMWIGEN